MDDVISRQAAIDYFVTNVGFHDEDGYPIEDECELRKIWTEIIEGIPPATGVISRQAAIDVAKQHWYKPDIVGALEELPPTQPEPCEDAVSREAVKEQMLKYGFLAPDMTVTEFVEDCLPPVTPKQRTGKWIPSDSQCGIQCSVCGVSVDDFCHSIDYIDLDYEPNFCPNCGAKMEGANKDAD